MQKVTKTDAETKALAKVLFKKYPTVKWWLLYGDLGAGKTTFVKGFASALGIEKNSIKSPTFALLEDHGDFLHVDLYRLERPDASIEAQLEEYAAQGKRILLEWPERLSELPKDALILRFSHEGEDQRTIEVIPPGSV